MSRAALFLVMRADALWRRPADRGDHAVLLSAVIATSLYIGGYLQ